MNGAGDERPVDPDWETLRRVAGGEVGAFAALVERHQDRVTQVCARLLGDVEEARDAAQEVFLRAYRKAGSYRPQGQVFTWLYRIAVNYCLNRLRRRRLARFVPLLGAEPGRAEGSRDGVQEPADGRPDGGRRLEAKGRWRRLRAALVALPPGQRTVVILAKLEGMSYREIARAMGITESAVESRLVRAMRALTKADAEAG